MKFRYEFEIKPLAEPITHQHNLLLIGSCFTENIGEKLKRNPFLIGGDNFLQASNANVYFIRATDVKISVGVSRKVVRKKLTDIGFTVWFSKDDWIFLMNRTTGLRLDIGFD